MSESKHEYSAETNSSTANDENNEFGANALKDLELKLPELMNSIKITPIDVQPLFNHSLSTYSSLSNLLNPPIPFTQRIKDLDLPSLVQKKSEMKTLLEKHISQFKFKSNFDLEINMPRSNARQEACDVPPSFQNESSSLLKK